MRKLTLLLLGIILLFARQALAQSQVTGQITDANGLPIPGATIKIKSSRTGMPKKLTRINNKKGKQHFIPSFLLINANL